MLTGHSTTNTGIRGNSDYTDERSIVQPSFDNILAAKGYRTEYYGKWHTPCNLAATYKNKVRTTGKHSEPGVMSEGAAYNAYLAEHVPERPLGEGELIEKGMRRPYTPDPVDERYGLNLEQLPKRKNGKPAISQSGEYGWLKITAEHSRTAFCVKETLAALERLKDGPFSLTCSIDPPHPPMVLPKCKRRLRSEAVVGAV